MNLEHQPTEYCTQCADSPIRHCANLRRWLDASKITFEEFAYNLALFLLTACDPCMRVFLGSLPDSLAIQFDAYLRTMLESEGDSPLVRPFVVDFANEAEIQRKRETMQPRIMQLSQSSRIRAANVPETRQ